MSWVTQMQQFKLLCPWQIQQELRQAVQTEATLREEQAVREELKEVVAREQAHAKALEKQVTTCLI